MLRKKFCSRVYINKSRKKNSWKPWRSEKLCLANVIEGMTEWLGSNRGRYMILLILYCMVHFTLTWLFTTFSAWIMLHYILITSNGIQWKTDRSYTEQSKLKHLVLERDAFVLGRRPKVRSLIWRIVVWYEMLLAIISLQKLCYL